VEAPFGGPLEAAAGDRRSWSPAGGRGLIAVESGRRGGSIGRISTGS